MVNTINLSELWSQDVDSVSDVQDWITDPVRSADYALYAGVSIEKLNPIW